ncbi:MAG: hypothetical protein A2504_03540 [Bdellovibrionales bacterium RIFOXYD12_FULL_39_22]|nr:MAG: hypothetical protein A2385_11290 [Bdellovibrionales bacterium RIFOXYB1_FULL_39_21]OFZ41653.1 MAG: hypothetical protein A2485_01600 [Bdellovibrionales bacterium RIFOXYC12_FULL_39_17]OFZ46053.1 MAG: hypothetical protein A2404_11965 [Bdellovibrionales bacterium RIFOXYC1_FULL_39_130]OFZ71163.1 MAG: hypothetical protein A2451_02725 [Bdellovibrionales bacterium RIFOXYC2_FULL_39_8]OFZ74880.1 MAG: hypothetical protein A2560_15005 [Bdellovibrionales bacterium RIFOXYD1_FULL_39_84]OFZ92733.1 MAG:
MNLVNFLRKISLHITSLAALLFISSFLLSGCQEGTELAKDTPNISSDGPNLINHSSFPKECSKCHNNVRPAIHPKTTECGSCHVAGVKDWQNPHSPSPSKCSNCHEYFRPKTDHPAEGDCLNCHAVKSVNNDQFRFNHADLSTGCISCHATKRPSEIVERFLHSAVDTEDCAKCHLQPGVSWSEGAYNHTPPPTLCSQCHNEDRHTEVQNSIPVGFPAECSMCHKKPGIQWEIPNTPTCLLCHGSGTSGRHESHNEQACSTCHNNYLLHPNHMENSGDGISFVYFDQTNPAGSWNAETKTCNNMSCHGNISWNSTAALSCTNCHIPGSSIAGGGRHAKHQYDCEKCHANYKEQATHKDGVFGPTGSTSIVNFGTAPISWDNTTKNCSSVGCHGNLGWTQTTISCVNCHSAGSIIDQTVTNGSGMAGKHNAHTRYACSKCHNNYELSANHRNGVDNTDTATSIVAFDTFNPNAIWDNQLGKCSTTYCHGNGTPTWYSNEKTNCSSCHSMTPVSGKHNRHLGVRLDLTCLRCHSTPTTLSANIALPINHITKTVNLTCITCHADTVTFSNTIIQNSTTHINGVVNVKNGAQIYGYAQVDGVRMQAAFQNIFSYNSTNRGTCLTNNCHTAWGGGLYWRSQ